MVEKLISIKNHTVYIALGSNIGDKSKNLIRAIEEINTLIGEVTEVSSFFENEPQGFKSDNIFVNACIICKTNLNPLATLKELKNIEKKMGRKKTNEVYKDRIIDLDIIFFDKLIYNSEKLTIPHKEYKNRSFVLIPLKELSPFLEN
ncbi:MAG: 2-amino-4-hydroxy-6-hydroxymethyldihydropteridine diphosphokinase [Flavobacteriia bacterium]|jgi:2-amino-4-hydroxy-6-hydroxymethyldihydropteridine diphosphokinase|nr:2-amino-4-hydroxy-6-hydroxymethyldihydropteridine diphosphokinase [Flavobacteriia bacterium]